MTMMPEIRVPSHAAVRFPTRCPLCQSMRIYRTAREAEYVCKAKYTEKDQIQNHTDVFWGSCPKAKEPKS